MLHLVVDFSVHGRLSCRRAAPPTMLRSTLRLLTLAAALGLLASLAQLPAYAFTIPASPLDLTHPVTNRIVAGQLSAPPPAGLQPATSAAAPIVQAATGPQREVFGFVSAGVVDDPLVGYPSWDFSMLTTVAYFAEHVNWDGHLITNDTG